MGLLDWLFPEGKKKTIESAPISAPEPEEIPAPSAPQSSSGVSRSDGWLRVASNDFFGQYKDSQNKKFTLGWCDSFMEVSADGREHTVSGKYILLEDDRPILQGSMERPNDGNVADNGVFSFCDWMNTTSLKGTFRVFNKEGSVLISHLFKANLNRSGLSNNGSFAICQTLSADGADGNKLAFFDVNSGELIWKIDDRIGGEDFKIDPEKKIVYCCFRNRGEFGYSFKGKFLDDARWRDAKIDAGTGWEVYSAVSEILGGDEVKDFPNLLARLDKALVRAVKDRPEMRAQIERAIAEVFDCDGKIKEAIQHYEAAIRLNPKVGVKRRLEALKKSSGSGG